MVVIRTILKQSNSVLFRNEVAGATNIFIVAQIKSWDWIINKNLKLKFYTQIGVLIPT